MLDAEIGLANVAAREDVRLAARVIGELYLRRAGGTEPTAKDWNAARQQASAWCVDFGHMRVKAAVKVGIKLDCVHQSVGGRVLVLVRNFLDERDRHDHLVRHVQACHGELPARGEYLVGRVRVVPDVGFGHRRYIARLNDGAAHDDDFLHQARKLGLQHQRCGQIAQRADGNQRNFTWVGTRHVDNELRRRTRINPIGGGVAPMAMWPRGGLATTSSSKALARWAVTMCASPPAAMP